MDVLNSKIQNYYKSLKNKKLAFIGVGVSHGELIKMYAKMGFDIMVHDRKNVEEIGGIYDEILKLGVRFCLGEDYLEKLCESDIIFRPPGMNFFSPSLSKAISAGKIVTSEMEVFFDLCPCKIYGVTGSDGKTTTTTIISEFLKAQGKKVHLGGNIGRALLPVVGDIDDGDVAVVELSSFQLISMRRSPDVAVITNISPNHLDVHSGMDEYIGAKTNILLHQNAFSRTVLNADNEITSDMGKYVRGQALEFSRRTIPVNGAYLADDGYIYTVCNNIESKIIHKDDVFLRGVHNLENYLAAITAVYGEVDNANILKVAKSFRGVEHRIEFVRELNGITWYNDSIATSPTRTIAGLDSFEQKLIIIAGGYDKKIPFEPLAPKFIQKAKALILMGVTAKKIENAVIDCEGYDPGILKIYHAENMENAVELAYRNASADDIVMLSPACASFDSYPNFEARGQHYKEIVNKLI